MRERLFGLCSLSKTGKKSRENNSRTYKELQAGLLYHVRFDRKVKLLLGLHSVHSHLFSILNRLLSTIIRPNVSMHGGEVIWLLDDCRRSLFYYSGNSAR